MDDMIGKWRQLSIQNLIAISFSIAIVMMITIIGIVSFLITTRTVDENTNEYVKQLVNQINYDIEHYLNNIEISLNTIKSNEEIYSYFEMEETDSELEGNISDMLNDYLVSRNDAVNVFLVRKDGSVIVNEGGYELKQDFPMPMEMHDVKSADGEFMDISNAHIQNLIVDRYKWVVSCSTGIFDVESGDYLGTAVIDLNFNLIDDVLNNVSLGEKGYMFITDEAGNIVYHPKHELIYSGIRHEDIQLIVDSKDGYVSTMEEDRVKDYIISTSDYSGWKVVGAVYVDELNPYERVTKQIYILLIGLSLVLAILISVIISRRFLHPIKDLNDGMNRFKYGDLDTVVDIKEENEFGELADTFNDMTGRIKNLVERNKQSEKAKRKFELKSLQSQINPHFLYNTLDSIVWMAEAEMNREVVEMTDSLAKLFRIIINRGDEFVTVAQEIEHIESYLKIQKLRYGEKLNYEIKADPSLLSLRIVKIIIQPIVENAIYHGIKKLATPGMIWIRLTDKDEYMEIIIQDNGVGMDEETVRKLLEPGEKGGSGKGGIGVLNVDQRIKLHYGDEYGIDIESEEFEGTKITMKLPKVFTREDGNEKE
ncbi:two-component system, sensor histidine kinase YesM [Dethiosulfatibacter aminovorans DSM 17477]|uniref:histidine kinase n=2 Tax=Dethiosulfatibacter TaxID=448125 RepID=A0A1M6L2P2_9FIRM|nr:two-component system, sensor histidine kinase YesM [Dethiosulfatibacter aminovorans DSM 17477]